LNEEIRLSKLRALEKPPEQTKLKISKIKTAAVKGNAVLTKFFKVKE